MLELRIDPWDPEYGAAAVPEGDAPGDLGGVELDVEPGAPWDRPVPAPPAPPRPPVVAFIDGVRRAEARLFARHGDLEGPALAGTFAVGAVWAGPDGVRLAPEQEIVVGRVLAVGGPLGEDGEAMGGVRPLAVPCGGEMLVFEPRGPEGELDPLGVLQGLMRREEALAADRVLAAGRADLVVADGPVRFATRAPAVGLVKRGSRSYLPPDRAAVLARLAVGERSPVFRIRGPERWSWYLRIAAARPVEGPMVGVVRLEVSATSDLAGARHLAALAGAELPRHASDRLRDARAPQNLYPVGELERQLHRRLGDRTLVRRSIEAAIHRQSMEAARA